VYGEGGKALNGADIQLDTELVVGFPALPPLRTLEGCIPALADQKGSSAALPMADPRGTNRDPVAGYGRRDRALLSRAASKDGTHRAGILTSLASHKRRSGSDALATASRARDGPLPRLLPHAGLPQMP